MGMVFDDILDRFDGQGHIKVKVARLKNLIFGVSDRLTCADLLCHVL